MFESSQKRSEKILSVDFSQTVVKAAYAESSSSADQLLAYDILKVSSIEEQESDIVLFLNEFIKKNLVVEKEVVFSISEPVTIKYLVLPDMPSQEIRGAVKWQLQDEVPFDLDHASVDWQVAKEGVDQDGKKGKGMLFVIIQKEVVDHCLSIANQCGLKPRWITTASYNYISLLRYLPGKSPVTAILDIEDKGATINFYMGDKLNFVRTLPISEERITQSLTKVLVSSKGRIQLSGEEAEEIKTAFGIPQDENQMIKGHIQATHILSLMRPFLEALVRELKLSFDYFASIFDTDRPATLYLTGGGANLKNLDVYLSKALNIKVTPLPWPSGVEALNKANPLDQVRIMSVLGACLGKSEVVNLLPQSIKAQQAKFTRQPVFKTAIIAGAVILSLLLIISIFSISHLKREVKEAERHLQSLDAVKNWNEKVEGRESLVIKIEEQKIPAEVILRVVSLLVSREIILDELLFDQTAYQVILKGKIFAQTDLVEPVLTSFMQQLETSPVFTEVRLVSSQSREDHHEFEVKCDLFHD